MAEQRLSLRNAPLAPERRPQSRPYLADTSAPCVLAPERAARPDDEHRSATPS